MKNLKFNFKSIVQSKARWLLTLFAILTLGVGQMWAWNTLYLASSHNSWSTNTDGLNNSSSGKGVFYSYTPADMTFKIVNANNTTWLGRDSGDKLKPGDGGYNFDKAKSNNCTYNGNQGIVGFNCDQTGSNADDYPWIWLTRPTIQIKHKWNNTDDSWTAQNMTDNADGTYSYTGYYSGSNATNCGIGSDGSTMKYITSATLVGSPAAKDKCIFEYNSSGYKGRGTQTQNTGSLTITKLCGLTYNGNGRTGGTAVPSALSDQKYGSSVTLSSAAMTKTGYTLTGWNTANDGSGTHYALGASFTFSNKNNTLYAEWTQTINVDENTGTTAGSMSIYFNAGSLKTFTAATKTDWILDSYWTSSDNSGSKVIDYDATKETASLVSNVTGYTSADGKWTRTAATTLYAHWKQTYTVTYNANFPATAISTSGTVPTDDTEYASGATVTVKYNSGSLVARGYTFGGWNTKSDGSGTTYAAGSGTFSITEPTTLYAKWTATNYTASNNIKEASGTANGQYNVTFYTTSIVHTSAPSKTGYNVAGYYKEAGFTTLIANANLSLTSSTTTYTTGGKWYYESAPDLYVKWSAKQYTITLDEKEGTVGGTAKVNYDATKLTNITAPTYTGYHVVGYYGETARTNKVADASGNLQSNVTGFTTGTQWTKDADATLYTKWEPNTYTITLNDHDATTHGTTSTTATYDSPMPDITVPHKDGYIFGGYWTGTSGTGTKYYNEDGTSAHICDLTSATTLHAKWTGITYHVAFAGNGATSGSMSDQDHTYGSSKALTTNAYTRTGYYFLGWNTNADGSGTAYYNGKSVSNLTTTPGETVTLHAQWAQTHTLYFLNLGTSGWHSGGSAAATNRYAYASITYDGQTTTPLGTGHGTKMTAAASSIHLPNVSSGIYTWCWSIAGVPDGATIVFSDNTDSHKTGNLSGWTADKPYYCNGNGTWYALDGTNQINRMTNMSVHIGEGDFGSWKYFALDKHNDGTYAIINLSTDQTYQYKYSNWYEGGESGAGGADAYIVNNGSQVRDYSDTWTLNGGYNVMLKTNTHPTGEYKFQLTWSSTTPRSTIYLPRGVNLTTTTPTEAKEGESVTVSLTADAWNNLTAGTDMDNPTYYFEFSTDNSNWRTIATVSPTSSKKTASASYTFAAQSGYFRVKLVNDNGVASYSGSTAFSTYSTKSFYVYNPYNNSKDKWQTLHLYTWDSNDGDKTYNGSWPGKASGACEHGNNIVAKGGDWFYITIDERANQFQLVGDADYNVHKTENCFVANYIPDEKYMIFTESSINKVKSYEAKGTSDWRLQYTPSGGSSRYSDIYNTTLDGTTITTSMWMNAANNGATLKIQRYSGSAWVDQVTYTNTGNGFGGIVPSGKRDKGYVFQMQLNINTGTPSSSTISNVAEYDGPYYVRTDGLQGGWNVYKTSKHTMHHNEASLNGTPAYNYYLCKWISTAGTNVKFTVANDYNKELVASLEGDASSSDPLYNRQTIPTATNVRFSYNTHTNTLTRSYLSAATEASSRFLVLVETTSPKGKIYKENGVLPTGASRISGLNDYELIFEDKGNWVYQLTMQANPGAHAKVTAKYNNKEPEFIPSVELIDGETDTKYSYRIVYDFKTNVLTNAWLPNGDAVGNIDLNTNAMLIRNGQGAATQITFTSADKSITHAKKLIGVMQFDYNNMVGKMNSWNSQAYQYCMYYISFPFDVNVNDIFGVGTYGIDWKLQYYDGAERAEKGFFRGDGTTTFWKDVPANGTLKEYVGYSLLLNRIKFNDGSSEIWENKTSGSSVYLYFPSTKDVGTISQVSADIEVPAHECTKGAFSDGQEKSHNNTDSHWNMLGIPILANETTGSIETFLHGAGTEDKFRHLYAWDYSDNSLSVEPVEGSFTFQAMKSYMVQFHGHVTFSGAGIPSAIAARRTPSDKNYNIELQVLNPDEQMINHAYVNLEEGANADFALNEDLYMENNNRAINVYTFAGSYEVSANILPIEDATIPVGVYVKTAGTYTFHMPDNFSGTVTLIDTFDGTETNLALEDYTVDLQKGTINDRFMLRINIKNTPTAIDGVEDGGSLNDGKAHKFIMNDQMYIIRDGQLYDARGAKVK